MHAALAGPQRPLPNCEIVIQEIPSYTPPPPRSTHVARALSEIGVRDPCVTPIVWACKIVSCPAPLVKALRCPLACPAGKQHKPYSPRCPQCASVAHPVVLRHDALVPLVSGWHRQLVSADQCKEILEERAQAVYRLELACHRVSAAHQGLRDQEGLEAPVVDIDPLVVEHVVEKLVGTQV